jgi:hypothetical protein
VNNGVKRALAGLAPLPEHPQIEMYFFIKARKIALYLSKFISPLLIVYSLTSFMN